jgi:Tfp pilus assembly protein PilX
MILFTIKKKEEKNEAGFTLLIAALVASVVLALGTSIFELAQKEVLLSSIGRDSQFAFYAADTAAECALYWDFRYNYFATSSPTTGPAQNPTCDGQPLNSSANNKGQTVTGNRASGDYTITSSIMDLFTDTTNNGGYCAQVSVEKCNGTIAADGTCTDSNPPVVHTLIHANGYSVSCETISTAPQALQRTAEWRY